MPQPPSYNFIRHRMMRVDAIVELRDGGIRMFEGNYDDYAAQREAEDNRIAAEVRYTATTAPLQVRGGVRAFKGTRERSRVRKHFEFIDVDIAGRARWLRRHDHDPRALQISPELAAVKNQFVRLLYPRPEQHDVLFASGDQDAAATAIRTGDAEDAQAIAAK